MTSPYNPPGITQGGLRVTLSGVDITAYVDESSIDIKDTLGQGAGSGSGASPRASTFAFMTSLGPAATAVGSGSHITQPTLVRNGEVVIYDVNGNRIFGGYATKLTDQTDKTAVLTKVEGVDYWQTFSRVVVNQIFSGQTDVQIIRTLLTTYAPWVGLQYLPSVATMTFASKNYRNKTLLDCLQDIIDSSGNQAWLDPYKAIHYVSPSFAQTAPFALSNSPDFRTSFQVGVDEYDIDDTAAINRVFFFGGKKPSNDFAQDVSTQANGANTTFMLAYYPRATAKDGKVHVTVNGAELVLGYMSGASAKDKLKSQGGLADVLINADAHTLIFDVAPSAGSRVICTYRYELPLMVQLVSQPSYQFYGTYLDGTLSDTSVVDTNIAVQRCKILLLEQAYGLVTLKARCWRAGLQSGMAIRVDHSIRGIHTTFIIQEVDVVPKGNGLFEYALTLGAWNWSLVDLLNHLIRAASTDDTSSQEDTTVVDDQELFDQMHASFTVAKTVQNFGGYKAHATVIGDGFDAFAGFASITS